MKRHVLRSITCLVIALPVAVLGVLATSRPGVSAGENSAPITLAQAARPKPADAPKPAAVTPEQEQLVFAFIKEHHRELEVLLTHLRQHRAAEYARVMRDMSRNVERIEGLRTRDVARYELEVKLWQSQSRSQLLAARITMADENQLRDDLRKLLREQAELRIQLLQHEKSRMEERMKKLDEQIARLEQNQEANLDRQLNTMLQGAKAAKPAPGPNKKK